MQKALAQWQRDVTMAFVEAGLADEDARGDLVPGSAEACARATSWMDQALAGGSPDLRRGFFVLFILMEWLPVVLIGTVSRMSRLPLGRRITYLESLERSRFSLFTVLFVAFKVPLGIPAFEEGDELASTGFDRPDTSARRRLPQAGGAS
jgi:hypothetical protein